MPPKTLTPGERFNDWTVVRFGYPTSLCRCKCGVEKNVQNGALRNGFNKQCRSCARRVVGEAQKGKSTRTYAKDLPTSVFKRLRICVDNTLSRCTDKTHPQWKDYGGRGIKMYGDCISNKRLFLLYLATLPGHDDPSLILDREDNDGDYEPGNLRFVTRTVSNRNRRLEYGDSLPRLNGRFTSSTST